MWPLLLLLEGEEAGCCCFRSAEEDDIAIGGDGFKGAMDGFGKRAARSSACVCLRDRVSMQSHVRRVRRRGEGESADAPSGGSSTSHHL